MALIPMAWNYFAAGGELVEGLWEEAMPGKRKWFAMGPVAAAAGMYGAKRARTGSSSYSARPARGYGGFRGKRVYKGQLFKALGGTTRHKRRIMAAKRKNASRQRRLIMPTRLNPRTVSFKHTCSLILPHARSEASTHGGRMAIRRHLVINNFNTPFEGITTFGVQPYGHDQLQDKYESVEVRGVKTVITVRNTTNLYAGGTFYVKPSDDATTEDWTTDGSHYDGIVDDGITTVTAEGFRHLVKRSPRYMWREIDQTYAGNEVTAGKAKMISYYWTPKKTNLMYKRDDWMQTLGGINTNPPSKKAYLHFGFISNDDANLNAAFLEIKITKIFYVRYGNRKVVSNS